MWKMWCSCKRMLCFIGIIFILLAISKLCIVLLRQMLLQLSKTMHKKTGRKWENLLKLYQIYNFVCKGIYCGRCVNKICAAFTLFFLQIQWDKMRHFTVRRTVRVVPSLWKYARFSFLIYEAKCSCRFVFVSSSVYHLHVRPQNANGDIFVFHNVFARFC